MDAGSNKMKDQPGLKASKFGTSRKKFLERNSIKYLLRTNR